MVESQIHALTIIKAWHLGKEGCERDSLLAEIGIYYLDMMDKAIEDNLDFDKERDALDLTHNHQRR